MKFNFNVRRLLLAFTLVASFLSGPIYSFARTAHHAAPAPDSTSSPYDIAKKHYEDSFYTPIQTKKRNNAVLSAEESKSNDLSSIVYPSWQTNLLNGLASVMTQDFQQQLIQYFIDGLQSDMATTITVTFKTSPTPVTVSFELNQLFPQTYQALSNDNIIPLGTILNSYKSAFSTDLKKFPTYFQNIFIAPCLTALTDWANKDKTKIPDLTKLVDAINNFTNAVNQASAASPVTQANGTVVNLIPPAEVTNVLIAASGVVSICAPSDNNVLDAATKIVKYGSFLVSIAGAQSSSDVAAALNNVLLPPGSFAKKNQHTLFLNSYVGVLGGPEYLDKNNSWNGYVGGYAPVGLEWKIVHGAPRLFFQVLDLGSLVSYQLNNSTPSTASFGLQQVFSPGIYGVTDFNFMEPFVLGFGASYSPQLRTVTVNGSETGTNDFRIGAFLAMDIPLAFLK